VRQAGITDRALVVRALARAFDRDPVANYVLRSDARRARAYETAFDVCFRHLILPHGGAWMAGDGAGAALWAPPGGWSTWHAIPGLPRLAGAVGLRRVPKVLRAVGRVTKKHPRAPHWYLFAIGVDPEHQGRGHGSALLRAVLGGCDERGEAAYLEASTKDNARLYERHGFRVTEEVPLASDGPPVWLMWREPKRA
jgi:ribosomal protein S18 acetylase RimI-like enzyme